jgi:nijmegen breakage syndrome protein 1
VTSRFKGFDDDDDHMNLNSVPESTAVGSTPAIESQSQGLFVSQDQDMEGERDESQPAGTQGRTSRKRQASPIVQEPEDIMEQIAPATTALKRRRLAEGISGPPPRAARDKPTTEAVPKKVKKEIDVLEFARQQQEKAEVLAKAERETLREQMEGMDIEAIRNLAIVEEIEVKRLVPPPRPHARADESERWDDKWNGRKNYKKFRRRGAARGNARDIHRVIVPLEEVKKKEFGIGDEYWLEGDSQRKKKKEKGKETQDVSQSHSQARPKSRAADRAAEILANKAEEEIAQALDTDERRSSDVEIVEAPLKLATSAGLQRSQKLADKTSTSQNLPAQNKRAAPITLAKPAPAKKARQTVIRKEESDDSDDELKFRFRKRN